MFDSIIEKAQTFLILLVAGAVILILRGVEVTAVNEMLSEVVVWVVIILVAIFLGLAVVYGEGR